MTADPIASGAPRAPDDPRAPDQGTAPHATGAPGEIGHLRGFLHAWRVALRILRLMFRAELEYRGDFLLNVGVGVFWQASIIVFAGVLLTRFQGMAGWPSDAVLLIVGIRMLGHGLFVLAFGRVYTLTYLVQDGRIDGFLLRPMPVYRQVLLSQFPSNGLGDLLVGVGLFGTAVARVDLSWSAERIGYLVAIVVGATLVEGAVFTTLSAATLHYPSAYQWLTWVGELLETFGNYPLAILPALMRAAFTWVLPLGFVAYFPAATLTGRVSGLDVPAVLAAGSPVVGLALYLASRGVWNASLRRYCGVNG